MLDVLALLIGLFSALSLIFLGMYRNLREREKRVKFQERLNRYL